MDAAAPPEILKATIFVSVPSYRDPEVAATVANLFKQAAHPERVFVGVCQQNEPGDADCRSSPEAKQHESQIRVLTIPASEAKGPTYARHRIEVELYKEEEYWLGIDSHMRFVEGWDTMAILELLACPSLRPVLTQFPNEYDKSAKQQQGRNATLPSFIGFHSFHPRLGFPQQTQIRCKKQPAEPMPSMGWCAGFTFTLGECIQQVPYDAHTPYIFLGEEVSMFARMYTHGWDVYSPRTNLVFHRSDRTYRPVFWEQIYQKKGRACKVGDETRLERKIQEALSAERIHVLLSGNAPADDIYSLGTARTIKDFWDYVGLDYEKKVATRKANLGVVNMKDPVEISAKYGVKNMGTFNKR